MYIGKPFRSRLKEAMYVNVDVDVDVVRDVVLRLPCILARYTRGAWWRKAAFAECWLLGSHDVTG